MRKAYGVTRQDSNWDSINENLSFN